MRDRLNKFKMFQLRGVPEVVIAATEVDEELPFRDTPVFAQLVSERGFPTSYFDQVL